MTTTRTRLLAYTAVALTSSFGVATSAQAACALGTTLVAGDSWICTTNTTTTNTTGLGPTDRDITFTSTTEPTFLTVPTGILVDGYGLAWSEGPAGAFTTTVTNNGTIQVNVGNTPTAGGNGALSITSGVAPVVYLGTGDIFNLGVGNGLDVNLSGTSSFTGTIGGSVSSVTGDAINISHSGTAGGISLTTTAGETITAGVNGIAADIFGAANAGSITIVNNAAIGGAVVNTMTDGIDVNTLGTGAISVTNTGAIGSALDRMQSGGIEAEILNAASTANLSVTGTGSIWAATDGIFANNDGAGTTTVNYTGAINTSTGDGIEAQSTTGALSVTSGAITALGGNGILTSSTTGNQTISVGGNVTSDADGVNATATSGTIAVTTTGGADITGTVSGIDVTSTGARTITVGTGSVVTGGTQAIFSDGDGVFTLNNSGTVGTAGGLAVWFTGGTTAGNINNLAGGILNGRLDLNAGNDTVTNAGTWNAAGAQNFYAGTNVINNQAAGVINVAAGTSFNGLTTLTNAGTVNAASGLLFDGGATAFNNTGTINLTGALDLGAGADSFANTGAGILNLTGNASLVGVETLTQSGRINLNTFTLTGTGAFVNSGFVDTSGSAGLAGFTSLSNSGTIDLAAGTFTVPAVVFTNSGTILADEGASTITGQTGFTNTGLISLQDGATNDVLTLNSNYNAGAGATLALDIDNTTADRLVITGNVTGTGTNVLLTPVAGTTGINTAGILIVDVTGTAAANAFTTTSVLNPIVDFAIEQRGVDFFAVTIPNAAAFSPVLVGNLIQDMWYQGAEAFNGMAAARGGEAAPGISVWLSPYYSKDRFGNSTQTFTTVGRSFTIPTRMHTTRQGAQGGVDFNAGIAAIGLTGGYQRADLAHGPTAKGWNIGGYAMAGGTEGMYGNLLVKYDKNRTNLDHGVFGGSNLETHSKSLGADGEVGYRFRGSDSVGFDASAGLAYVDSTIDTFSFGGIDFDFDNVTSLRGRIGARAVFYNLARLFIGGKLMHEFNGDTDLLLDSFTDASVSNKGRGTWGRLEAGLGGGVHTPLGLQAWGDFGDVKGWGVRGLVRLSFGGQRVEEVAPPPPPPPPPPAATQTCADGSVILATDACPVPPPPPPPPPPPSGERG